ncbi:Hypothetical protein J6889_04676 [Nakaseomyces glabratus]
MWNRLLATILLYLQLTFAYNYKYGAEIFGKEKTSLNAPGYPHGCSPSLRDQLKPGLSMEIYSYALVGSGNHCWDSAYLDPEFPRSGYLKHKLLGKAEGVLGPLNFLAKNPQCKPAVSTLPPGFNYPDPITITNFTMILYGYFAPKKSGKYTFKLAADDLLLMNFGADNAFDCCSHEQTKNNIGEYIAYSVWPSTNMSVTVYLESSIYYPLRLFFNNRDAIAQFDFSYYLDDSPVRETDFSEMFFSIPDGVKCPAHIGYKFECRSIKSTTTYSTQYITTKSAKNEIALTSTIYYVATPCADKPTPPLCGEGFYDPVNKKCFTPEPDYTTTINKGNGEYETDLISHIVLKDHNGTPTKTIRTTIKLTPTEDYTTTVTSDGHTITEVVSHITTTDSAGEGVVYVTTRMFYAEVGDAVHTSARPYSQPSVVTRTVSESDGVVDTVVISYFPSVGEDGVTRTVTSTVSTITADYTTTVTSDGHTITEVVSHITTTDSAGEGVVYVTTRMFYAEVGDAVHTSARPYSQPSVVTRTVSESDGVVDTVVISYFPSVGEDGVTRTVTSTVSTITADYTTTVTSDGHTITEVVSHITTTDSAGREWLVTRTVSESDGVVDTVVISYFPSVGEDGVTRTVTSTVSTITADYTTTVTSDGHTITEVVSHITTTDSAGEGVVYVTTRMFYAEVGDAVHTSARPYSQPSVVTRTVSESDGVVDTVVISYFPSVGEDGVTRTVTSTVSTITADYTTTVTSDGHTITEVVSHITTTDSAGEGVVYVTTRMFYAEVGDAVHTSARPYSQPSVVTRTVSESDGVVDTVVISYFPSVGEDGVTRTVTSTVSTITADYTTTVTSDGHTITEVVSHITTTDSAGEGVVYVTTRMFYAEVGDAVHTSARPYSQPSVVTRTVSESDGVVDTVVISYFPSVGEDGVTRTVTSTVSTITADYTTTVTSDGHTITEVVSHITTTDSAGEGVVYVTTRMFYAEVGDAVHTSARPYSQPSVVTRTVSESDGVVDTVVISYFPSVGEDGVTRTVTSTVSTITADYTTTVTSDGHTITEVVSHITTTDSAGEGVVYVTTRMFYAEVGDAVHTSARPYSQPSVVTRTVSESDGVVDTVVISYFPSVGEDGVTRTVTSTVSTITADYTTTVTSDGHTITEVVSHITTTDSAGEGVVYVTTRMFYAEVGDAVHTSARPYSQPSVVTRTVSESDGVVDTVVISYFPSVGEDGVTRTVTSTVSTITADYTTTVTSDGHTITEVVSHITTTDSAGEGVVYVTTRMFYAEVGDAVHTSARPYSQPSVVTRTVSESDGVVDTVVISYFPSVGEDGVTRTVTSTVSTITADYTTTVTSDGHTITEFVSHVSVLNSLGEIAFLPKTFLLSHKLAPLFRTRYRNSSSVMLPSLGIDSSSLVCSDISSSINIMIPLKPSDAGEADYTTTIDKGNGEFETDLVSHITTKDSDGKPTTITTTIPLKPSDAGEADYTTTIDKGNGEFETDLVSHITTKDSDGKPTTITTTIPLKPSDAGEADYTTTIDKGNGEFETDLVSHITTKDSDGKPTTITTTIPLKPSDAGEADYTTTIDKGNGEFETDLGNGEFETDLVSHITTKDSDGKPTTITTTIPLKPSDAGEADYTTTIISDGHTITEVVSHVTTTDSDGKTITYITTMASYDQVDEGVFTSPAPYSQPPVVTSTVTEDDGSSKTVVISYFPSEGEDGVTRTGINTVSTILLDGGQASHSSQAIFDGYQSLATRSSLRNSTKLSDVPSKSAIINTPHGSTHLTAESAPTGGITNQSESLLSPSVASSIKSDRNNSVSDNSISISSKVSRIAMSGTKNGGSNSIGYPVGTTFLPSKSTLMPSISVNIAEGGADAIQFSLSLGSLSIVVVTMLMVITTV